VVVVWEPVVVPFPVGFVGGFAAGGTSVSGVIFVPFLFSSDLAFWSARRMSSWALE
jgi:uncharacterized membrane protein YfcA